MQGGTVEQAVVVASPQDLTRGWSYSALSRARGATRLLIADTDRHQAERASMRLTRLSLTGAVRRSRPAQIRRMLVRDDEDLAIDQFPVGGHEDDRVLAAHRGLAAPFPRNTLPAGPNGSSPRRACSG